MAKKKNDKPKAVCLPLDRLSIQLGFMDHVRSGYLFKLIVYYCMGDTETVNRLLKELKSVKDYTLVLMAFEENKAIIDENLNSYAEKCEKNRQIALIREEKRRAYLETQNARTYTNVNERERTVTNTKTNTDTNTNTDTDTDTDTNTDTDTKSSSLHSEDVSLSPDGDKEREAREVISFINEKCKENLAQLAPLTTVQAIWIFNSCSRRAWQKILSDLDDLPDLRTKHLKQFKAYENFYNHRKANNTLEPVH